MKRLDVCQMENVQGGDAASAVCSTTCGILGIIWGAAAGAATAGWGIVVGLVVSVACGELFC